MKNSMKLALCGGDGGPLHGAAVLNGGGPCGHAGPAGHCRLPAYPRGGGGGPALGFWRCTACAACWGCSWRRIGQALLFYVLFFGHYPALFAVLGRIRAKALRYAAKLLVFNAAMALEVLLSVYLLGIPFESFAILGPLGPVAAGGAGQRGVHRLRQGFGGLIVQYLHRLHPRMAKILRGK